MNGNNFAQSQSGLYPLVRRLTCGKKCLKSMVLTARFVAFSTSMGFETVQKSPQTLVDEELRAS
jgi:hypothetical protein